MKTKPARTSPRTAGIKSKTGCKSRVDRWLLNLSRQVSLACDRFWLATAERRHIERHRTRGFNPY